MAKKKSDQVPYYFSERLQAQLAKISEHSLTVVEAPSGFGKTTAIREYFAKALRGSAREKWYTCLGESPEKAWAGICGLFSDPASAIAEELTELGVPTLETLPDIVALLREYRCHEAIYVIIDNYQLFANTVQKKLIMALSACQDKNLHIIIITQPLKHNPETTHPGNPYHTIALQDFLFDHAAIAKYCRLAGIKISAEAVEQIQASSEGWIAALRLQLKHYAETGAVIGSGAINSLVETAVWNKLSAGEKAFMSALSLMDGFTVQQATIMGDGIVTPESIANLLSIVFFIRYVADKKVYSIHSILRDFLLERFAMLPQDTAAAMHRKAAAACLAVSDYHQAALFFIKVSDYDAILSMPFTDQYFFNNQEYDTIQFFEQIFQECPPQTLLKYPLTISAVGIQFYKKGMREQYDRAVKLLEDFCANPPDLPEGQLYRIKGEFEMMLFFSCFNDVAKMGEHHKKAYEYLKYVSVPPRSHIYVGNLPWAVGVPSVVSVYWNVSGGLQKTLEAMDECLPFYSELAGGHGAGGDILLRAEACFARGDDAEAERLCHETLYTAKSAGQTSNCLCAQLVLARIGILRGDENAYNEARRHMAGEMEQARQIALTRLGELCLAHLDMAFGNTDALPEWMRRIEAIQRTLYGVTQPHAVMLHCLMLLLEKRHVELRALTKSAMETAQAMHYALLHVYHRIFLARAGLDAGRDREAVDHLREALSIALPDRVYLPFAEHGDALLPLLEHLREDFDAGRMEECLALCRRWIVGVAVLRRLLPEKSSTLTPQQRDIALLIRDGLSAKQIAAKLFLSENTVASVRKEIYRKLHIHSNMELAKAKLRPASW